MKPPGVIARRASPSDRETCLRIRYDVFVLEQGFSADLEPDQYDATAIHYIALDDGEPIGAARAIIDPTKPYGHIGRVAVSKAARGVGAGVALMHAILDDEELCDIGVFRLSAQLHAVPFYERLGFEVLGQPYDAAGAPHLAMQWTRERQR